MGLGRYPPLQYHTVLSTVSNLIQSTPDQPLTTSDPFIVSVVVPFPGCYLVGITQYGGFSDRLLSLSKVHLCLLRVLSWLDSSFLFSTE